MSRTWLATGIWLIALVVTACSIPFISPNGMNGNEPVLVGVLIVLQLSGVVVILLAFVAAWRARKRSANMASYAVIPLIVMAGIGCLGDLVVLSEAIRFRI